MNMSLEGYGALVGRPASALFFRDNAGTPPGAMNAEPPLVSVDPGLVESWHVVHARIVELGVERTKHEHELCRWLVAAKRLGVAARAGFASLAEYAVRHARLPNRRRAKERLRVGEALVELPVLDAAFAAGEVCWSKARELSRIATPETEKAWVDWARDRGASVVEKAVARHTKGETPDAPGDPSLETRRIALELRPETLAIFRDAQARIRKDLGPGVDDDTFVYELARRALGGPGDEGRASYQIAITTCDRCAETSIDAGGESHPVEIAVAEMACCDAQHVGIVGTHVGSMADPKEAMVDGGKPHGGAIVDASGDHEDSEARDIEDHVGSGAVLGLGSRLSESASGSDSGSASGSGPGSDSGSGSDSGWGAPTRASQTIPPAIRRQVMRRDRRRCVVPGCRNHLFLDVHHLDPRAEGGSHAPERLACLCGAHHRNVHLGTLTIDGTGTEGFTVRHADGTPYGSSLRPSHVDLAQQTLAALTHVGFKTKQARGAIDRVLAQGAPSHLADFVRAALGEATPVR